jgi:hypothetical protein
VGHRAGLDRCEKSRPHRDFFFSPYFARVVSCRVVSSGIVLVLDERLKDRKTACCGFFHYEKSDGFGRDSIPGPSSP